MKKLAASLILLTLLSAAETRAQGQVSYEFNAAKSKLELDVYKEGLFKAFGHNHLVAAKEFSGRVVLDVKKIENSSVTLRIAAGSLVVLDSGNSEKDRRSVQSMMLGEKVLDTARFPEIVFTSAQVAKAEKLPDGWNLTVAGTLRLHGLEKRISLPVALRLNGADLGVRGETILRQGDYGIVPVRIAGGAVKVKDAVRIRFEIHARAAVRP